MSLKFDVNTVNLLNLHTWSEIQNWINNKIIIGLFTIGVVAIIAVIGEVVPACT